MLSTLRLVLVSLLLMPFYAYGQDLDEELGLADPHDPTIIWILESKDWAVIIQKGSFSCGEGKHKVIGYTLDTGIESGCAEIDDDTAMNIVFDNGKEIHMPPLTNFYPEIDDGSTHDKDTPARPPNIIWGFKPSMHV